MNPIFVPIVIIAAIISWFLLNFTFNIIGKGVKKVWQSTMNKINGIEENKRKKELEKCLKEESAESQPQ